MKEEGYLNKASDEIEEKYKKGQQLTSRGNYNEGKEIYEEIIEEEQDFVPAYNKLAVIAIYQDKLEEAQEWLNKALTIDNEFAPSISNLGSIMREKGNLPGAKSMYEKAIAIDEEYGPAYNNLGVVLREQGKYTQSVKYLKKARKLGSYSVKVDAEKPLYKEPGCFIPIALVILIIVIIIFLIT